MTEYVRIESSRIVIVYGDDINHKSKKANKLKTCVLINAMLDKTMKECHGWF